MNDYLKNLVFEDGGVTTVEYAVLLALIVAACLGSISAMANATAGSFDDSADELSGVLGG